MQARYGIALAEACYGPKPLSLRRLKVLVGGIGPGGALHRVLNPQGWQWNVQEELLASLAELIDYGNRLLWALMGRKPPKPIRITRPGQGSPPRQKPASADEVHQFFSARKSLRSG